jgi:small-conductance mechanosensitive channel
VVVTAALIAGWFLRRLVVSRIESRYDRYYGRKFVRYGIAVAVIALLVIIWQPFGAQFAAILGFATAGLAFAMQEVIGALAGWFNITVGRIFRVGDRIQMAGVRGDVIDITPLRTKLMEIGSESGEDSWVKGRQHTGRMVAISNKSTFTDPVYNFSAFFDFIWEELHVLIPHHEDHRTASKILQEEAESLSDLDEALAAMADLRKRFPVPETELLPRVYSRLEQDGVRLATRFVVPTRTARTMKDRLAQRIEKRLADAGIELIVTQVIQSGPDWEPIAPSSD